MDAEPTWELGSSLVYTDIAFTARACAGNGWTHLHRRADRSIIGPWQDSSDEAPLLFLRMVNGDLWALNPRMRTLLSALVPMNRLIFAQSPKTPGRLVSFAQSMPPLRYGYRRSLICGTMDNTSPSERKLSKEETSSHCRPLGGLRYRALGATAGGCRLWTPLRLLDAKGAWVWSRLRS